MRDAVDEVKIFWHVGVHIWGIRMSASDAPRSNSNHFAVKNQAGSTISLQKKYFLLSRKFAYIRLHRSTYIASADASQIPAGADHVVRVFVWEQTSA